MSILSDSERAWAAALSRLTFCNPFIPDRLNYEREALGDEFTGVDVVWNAPPSLEWERPNIDRIHQKVETLVGGMRQRILAGQRAAPAEIDLYEDVSLYALYGRAWETFNRLIESKRGGASKVDDYRAFEKDFAFFLSPATLGRPSRFAPEHVFATFFQLRRAFHHIVQHIVGRSMPAARLRATVWQSIFTTDIQRYQRLLYNRMGDFLTLIVGPSGTGKELVARAIALSRYIPFDPKTRTFGEDYQSAFHPLNLSALSPTLIESELFGHRRGAFTGALEDRAGWLEICRALGTVFLDEVGDIDPVIQVKLLRVLQTRTFQRLGDTMNRTFHGKIIAATNRDLSSQMRGGQMRMDFYYRLCSDMVQTPSLGQILAESPEELRYLVHFIATKLLAPYDESGAKNAAAEAESLTEQVDKWITQKLGRDYPWPGNFRELEQCVRNILIRGEYWPARPAARGVSDDLASKMQRGAITAEELVRSYCTIIQSQTRNYEETARRLGLDRRTVKAKVDEAMLEKLMAD